MGWSRKAKFGIHSGRTLRSWPSRKYIAFHYSGNTTTTDEFAVVKAVFKPPSVVRQNNNENDKHEELLGVDDGIPWEVSGSHRRYPQSPIIHSMNKHKRWMLPDLVKECIEQNYVENQYDKEVSKKARRSEKNRPKDSDEFRVIAVERHTNSFVPSQRPDCFSVASNEPCSNSSTVRCSTKSHAYVGDLKPKSNIEQCEFYYEFLSPYPEKAWPNNRQVTCHKKYSFDNVYGNKSRNKCKGRRNKYYRHGVPLELDEQEMSYQFPEVFIDDVSHHGHYSNQVSSDSVFPIGTYIHDVIEMSSRKNEQNTCSDKHKNQTTPISEIKYGKGDAIYVDKTDQQDSTVISSQGTSNRSDISDGLQNDNSTSDIKLHTHLLVKDIDPDHLTEEFKDNYYEGNTCPRKFIVKIDLNKLSPNASPNPVECSMLFEVSQKSLQGEAVINGNISISLPKPLSVSKTTIQNIEKELDQNVFGPRTVKEIVSVATEKCVQECVSFCQTDSIVVKKTSQKLEGVPVKFIQDICQEEPEVCEVTRAFQYSTTDVAISKSKENQDLFYNHADKPLQANDFNCGICLLHLEELHESGQTSLTQCSHTFCNECWKNYIVTCIQAGQGSITCPSWNCTTLVSEPLVWSSTSSEYYQKYCKMYYQHTITTNPRLRPCPAPNCSHLAYVASVKPQSSLPIYCHCGEVWCFHCQKAAHWPASCEEAEVFREKQGDYEEYKKNLLHEGRIKSVMVKRCPFCHYPIYKNIGCQHMVCRCQNEFCWECLSPWADHQWPCDKRVKALEEVELTDVNGSTRYNKYCKVSRLNFQERSRKNIQGFLKMVTRTTKIENSHKFVSDSERAPCSQLMRSYIENGISNHVQSIFHFKYLAHVVMENTAAAMAVAKYTKMISRIDRMMKTLTFIVNRLNEVLLKPALLTDKKNLNNVCELLNSGQRLIKEIHKLTRANRKRKY